MTEQTRRAFLAATGLLALPGCSSLAGNLSKGDDAGKASGSGGPNVAITDDFEDLGHWQAVSRQGSLSKSTDAYEGSGCAHVEGSGKTKEGHIVRSLSGADLRGTNFSMAVKLTNHEQVKVAIELHAPDSGHTVALKRTVVGPKDRWIRVNFGVTGVEDGADLSKVHELRILARPIDQNAKKPVDFFVDDLRTVSSSETGYVMFTFDDSHASHYRAFELMEEYDFAGVEGVIPESIGNDDRLNEDHLSTMAKGGWDISAHPNVGAYYFSKYEPSEQKQLLKDAQGYLESAGFDDGARHLLVPKNLVGSETFDLARKYYDTIFSFGGCPNAMPFEQKDAIVSRVYGKDVEVVKRYVDYAAEYGQLVVPLFHEIGKDGDLSEREFEKLLEYVEKQDVRVITASDLLEL
ncbi:polysaccharide deacetylase family protein [Haladaptatus sp. NG-SE-30]